MDVAYEGVNLLNQPVSAKYDQHCPLMGSGLNYYKANCHGRSRDITHKATCKGFPDCKGASQAERNAKNAAHKGVKPSDFMRLKVAELHKAKHPAKKIAELVNLSVRRVHELLVVARENGEVKCYE